MDRACISGRAATCSGMVLEGQGLKPCSEGSAPGAGSCAHACLPAQSCQSRGLLGPSRPILLVCSLTGLWQPPAPPRKGCLPLYMLTAANGSQGCSVREGASLNFVHLPCPQANCCLCRECSTRRRSRCRAWKAQAANPGNTCRASPALFMTRRRSPCQLGGLPYPAQQSAYSGTDYADIPSQAAMAAQIYSENPTLPNRAAQGAPKPGPIPAALSKWVPFHAVSSKLPTAARPAQAGAATYLTPSEVQAIGASLLACCTPTAPARYVASACCMPLTPRNSQHVYSSCCTPGIPLTPREGTTDLPAAMCSAARRRVNLASCPVMHDQGWGCRHASPWVAQLQHACRSQSALSDAGAEGHIKQTLQICKRMASLMPRQSPGLDRHEAIMVASA